MLVKSSRRMRQAPQCNCWFAPVWVLAQAAYDSGESTAFSIGWIVGAAVVLAGLAYFLGRHLGKRRSKPALVVRPQPPPTTPGAPKLAQESQAPSVKANASLSSSQSRPISASEPVPEPDAATVTTQVPSKGGFGLSTLVSDAALDQWWVRIPAKLRRYSAVLSTAWVDGMYLTAWPRWAMLLSLSSLAFGFLEGASHFSFLTIDATGSASPPAIVFAQMLPLLMIAVALGSLSANAGTMLVLGFAVGDYLVAGPLLRMNGNAPLPLFFYLRLPQLISYIFFFILAAVPTLATKALLADFNRRIKGDDGASVIVRTGAAAVVQAAIVYGWTLGAVMVIRISWAWAGHTPPLSERHYLGAANPWLPAIAAVAMAGRGWLAFRACNDKRLLARVRQLLNGFRQANQHATFLRRVPKWARTVLTALLMTLFLSGFLNSLPLGSFVLILLTGLLLARAYVFPKLALWTKWARLIVRAPLVLRLGAAIFVGYWLTRLVLALPGQATALNGVPGKFGSEIVSIFLGLLLIFILVPEQRVTQVQRPAAVNAIAESLPPLGVGAQLMLLAVFVLLTNSRAYGDVCLDPVCCFGVDDLAALAVIGLLLLLAFILLWEMFAAAAAIDAFLAIGETAEVVEGGALTLIDLDEDTYVIGKLYDTAIWEGVDGFEVLDVPEKVWTMALNKLWVQTGIDQGATFLLTSPLNTQTLLSTEYGFSVYGVEIQQLLSAGYTLMTDLAGNLVMVPPL